jgi:hypothetical protein
MKDQTFVQLHRPAADDCRMTQDLAFNYQVTNLPNYPIKEHTTAITTTETCTRQKEILGSVDPLLQLPQFLSQQLFVPFIRGGFELLLNPGAHQGQAFAFTSGFFLGIAD